MSTPDPTGWPQVSPLRRMVAYLRAWACTRICDGYDRRAGPIVDAAIGDRDRLADEVRDLRIRLGEPQDDSTP